MASSVLLLWALALLSITVEASSSGGSSDRSGQAELFGSDLTDLYNSPVYEAERMRRPLGGWLSWFDHSGVRVTLADGSRWLIHKGSNYGDSSQTVVTDDRHMSSKWTPMPGQSRNFDGSKTVADFVSAGGSIYIPLANDCNRASSRMMDQ